MAKVKVEDFEFDKIYVEFNINHSAYQVYKITKIKDPETDEEDCYVSFNYLFEDKDAVKALFNEILESWPDEKGQQ